MSISLKNTFFLIGVLVWATCVWLLTIPSREELRLKNHTLETRLDLEKQRGQLLSDELAEIRSRRTYEDGYRDAILKAEHSDHAVGYTEGYHAAIKQFGYSAPSASLTMGGGK